MGSFSGRVSATHYPNLSFLIIGAGSHSSHAVTYGPIPGGYENSINSAGSSARGGGDSVASAQKTLLETSSYRISFGDTIVKEDFEQFGKWEFFMDTLN